MSTFRVLAVQGSSRPDGRLEKLLSTTLAPLIAAGAEVRTLRLAETPLPVLRVGDSEQATELAVVTVREHARWADAFVLGTPEYHGNMSGVLKNWFDFHYEEFAGKLAAVVCSTGGGTGDLPITAVKNCVMWCHGFVLPFHVTAQSTDFASDGALQNSKVEDRATRIGHDLLRYGQLLRSSFEAAKLHQREVSAGFAGFHLG